MEQDHDDEALFQGSRSQGYQYSQCLGPAIGAEIDMDMGFDLPTNAEPQGYLPRSVLHTADGSANSGCASDSCFVPSAGSEIDMVFINSMFDYHGGDDRTSYGFSNPQDSPGCIIDGSTSEISPDAGAYWSQNYTYSPPPSFEQDEWHENRPVPLGEALYSPNAISASTFQSILPPSSSVNLIPTARSNQKIAQEEPKVQSSDIYRLDDMVISFPANQQQAKGRTKKPIPPERRGDYRLARNYKSCSRCKVRKIRFTAPRPCEACVKAAGSVDLARCICTQNSIVELRFGGFDLLLESFTRDFLDSEIESFHGPERSIRLGIVFYEGQDVPTEFLVPIIVRDYSNPDLDDPVLFHTVAQSKNSFDLVASERYAIVPKSIPKLKELLSWADTNMAAARGQSVQQLLITNLKEFMDQYCRHVPQLPLYDLLNSSAKLLKLVRCWRCPPYELSNSGDGDSVLASKAVKSQILLSLKEGIRNEEFQILNTLQRLLYGARGPGKNNRIPLWVCMWSLILTYRDCMAVYKQYADAPRRNSFQPGCSNHEMVVGASKHMYDVLTTNYAALFRTSSPLYIDWAKEKNFDLVGRNPGLRRAFDDLRAQIIRFYHSSSDFNDDDALLKQWVVDQDSNLRRHDPFGF